MRRVSRPVVPLHNDGSYGVSKNLETVLRRVPTAALNQGTGFRIRRPSAGCGKKDEVTDKRVESYRVPCLDRGSTPLSSTVLMC